MDTIYFSNWLVTRMKEKDWTQSDLSRKSGLTRAAISNYVAGKVSKPDEDALKSIAHAFGLPPETVFRAAGLLPPVPPSSALIEDIKAIVAEMDDDEKQDFLEYGRLRLKLAQEKQSRKREEEEQAVAAKRKKTESQAGASSG